MSFKLCSLSYVTFSHLQPSEGVEARRRNEQSRFHPFARKFLLPKTMKAQSQPSVNPIFSSAICTRLLIIFQFPSSSLPTPKQLKFSLPPFCLIPGSVDVRHFQTRQTFHRINEISLYTQKKGEKRCGKNDKVSHVWLLSARMSPFWGKGKRRAIENTFNWGREGDFFSRTAFLLLHITWRVVPMGIHEMRLSLDNFGERNQLHGAVSTRSLFDIHKLERKSIAREQLVEWNKFAY